MAAEAVPQTIIHFAAAQADETGRDQAIFPDGDDYEIADADGLDPTQVLVRVHASRRENPALPADPELEPDASEVLRRLASAQSLLSAMDEALARQREHLREQTGRDPAGESQRETDLRGALEHLNAARTCLAGFTGGNG